MLFRKRGTISSILAIALLIAVITSANAMVNYLNLQSETCRTRKPAWNLLDPKLELHSHNRPPTTRRPNSQTQQPQLRQQRNSLKMLTANLTTNSGKRTIQVRGVEDIAGFLKARRAYSNGTAAKNWAKANAGEILARAFSISLEDEVSLAVGERNIKVKVI